MTHTQSPKNIDNFRRCSSARYILWIPCGCDTISSDSPTCALQQTSLIIGHDRRSSALRSLLLFERSLTFGYRSGLSLCRLQNSETSGGINGALRLLFRMVNKRPVYKVSNTETIGGSYSCLFRPCVCVCDVTQNDL